MKIMVVGDTHGGFNHLEFKLRIAKYRNIHHVIQVGDFGMWPGRGGIHFLDNVQRIAAENNVSIYALPGNHEDHDQWEWWLNSSMPKDENGFTHIRSNVLIAPKVMTWKWNKKRFFICGGAVSIDRQWRRTGESWWPNEQFSEPNLASVLKFQGGAVDYLFTHDASNKTPWGFHLVPDPDSMIHRERIDKAIEHLKPKLHFHGHMHRQYDWMNPVGDYDNTHWVQTYGLDCDGEAASWGILDTHTGKFMWPKEVQYVSQA